MLCDVASIFVVRTLIVSQAYTMVLTLIDNTRIHIFIYMYSIPRRHFTCPFTDLLYVTNGPPFMILIYIHVTGEHFVLGPIDKTKIISSRISYQTTLLLGKPNAVDVKGIPYEKYCNTTAILLQYVNKILAKV